MRHTLLCYNKRKFKNCRLWSEGVIDIDSFIIHSNANFQKFKSSYVNILKNIIANNILTISTSNTSCCLEIQSWRNNGLNNCKTKKLCYSLSFVDWLNITMDLLSTFHSVLIDGELLLFLLNLVQKPPLYSWYPWELVILENLVTTFSDSNLQKYLHSEKVFKSMKNCFFYFDF